MKRAWFRVWAYRGSVAATVVTLAILVAGEAAAAMSDCLDATCRITAADGGRGTGCVFEISQGRVYVLTAAHVVGAQPTVQCEFWRQGHQSQPLAGTVTARVADDWCDAAVVTLDESQFGGVLPRVIPLAPRDSVLRSGATVMSVGCANGSWSTGWKGHALGYQGDELRFLPVPANGRSGSALFDADGKQIVGLVRARTIDDSEGIATPVQSIYRAFERNSSQPRAGSPQRSLPAQCPGGVCPLPATPALPAQRHYLLPYREKQRDGQLYPTMPQPAPVPVLPASPALPAVDFGPVLQRLDTLAAGQSQILDALQGRVGATPAPAATPVPGPLPMIDQEARQGLTAAAGAIESVGKTATQAATDAADAKKTATGLADSLDKVKASIAEDGTISQRFHARVEKVRAELEEKLGREPSAREERIAYLKDLVESKLSAAGALGGLGGLLAHLGIPAGVGIGVWIAVRLIKKDVAHKAETGDPLLIEKLLGGLRSEFSRVHDRIDSVKDRLTGAAAPAAPVAPSAPTPAP